MRIFSEARENDSMPSQTALAIQAAYRMAQRNGGTAHDFLHFYATLFSQSMRATVSAFPDAFVETFGAGTPVSSSEAECDDEGEVYWHVTGPKHVLRVTLTLVERDVADKLCAKQSEKA